MSKRINPYLFSGNKGFTLLELLVVVAILAATAFIATGTFKGVSEHANDRIVLSEMQEIAKAIRQFKQDTGYYPKTGPFDLHNYGGSIPYSNLLTNFPHSGSSNAERDRWFYSPANFYQLISNISPLDGTGHQLETWNSETGRGWRGPYLKGFAEGYLDIRDGINGDPDATPPTTFLGGNPTGDPLAGTNIPNVDGIADPFEHRAEHVDSNTLLDWCSNTDSYCIEREVWGRPYMVFDWDSEPWIVSMGPNGIYEQAASDSDDIVLNIE